MYVLLKHALYAQTKTIQYFSANFFVFVRSLINTGLGGLDVYVEK